MLAIMPNCTCRCTCGLTFDPPEDQKWWQPTADWEPSAEVRTVVRYGEPPTYRRAVRVDGGWMERGVLVDGTGRPGVIPWERVGHCWAGGTHPVVAVEA